MMTSRSIEERIERYVERIPWSGCWLWTGALHKKTGYVPMTINGKCFRGHRVIWQHFKGPVPHGLLVLHRCDIRCCVNPDHLFVGTHHDNNLDCVIKKRAAGMQRTHCIHGHEFISDNMRARKDGRRGCKECDRIKQAAKRYAEASINNRR